MKKQENTDKEEIRCLTPLHPEYPERLRNIPNPPRKIYVRGRLPREDRPTVGIIGSRSASAYGVGTAEAFSAVLSEAGVQVISGMARGIDGIAQRTAIQRGHSSFGVLGCGVDVIYPKENGDIFEKILEKGGLISEYPPGTEPLARLFPSRNRLIAGLADLLLVVEARVRSGTSITVRWALEQGKDIYAVPGRITDPMSAGCNRLIRDGAGMALSPECILEALQIYGKGDGGESPEDRGLPPAKIHLAKPEKMVYIALDLYPKTLGELSQSTGLQVPELLHILLELELRGLAASTGQNCYYKVYEPETRNRG